MSTSSSALFFNFVMAPLSLFFLFYYGSHPPVYTLYPLLQCPHTVCYHPESERHAALAGQSLKKRLAPTKQVPLGHFSPYLCPQISRQSSPSVIIPEIPVGCEIYGGVCHLSIAFKSSSSDFIFLTASLICRLHSQGLWYPQKYTRSTCLHHRIAIFSSSNQLK
jgi:hypothetical protein